jgi:hypothetical protein
MTRPTGLRCNMMSRATRRLARTLPDDVGSARKATSRLTQHAFCGHDWTGGIMCAVLLHGQPRNLPMSALGERAALKQNRPRRTSGRGRSGPAPLTLTGPARRARLGGNRAGPEVHDANLHHDQRGMSWPNKIGLAAAPARPTGPTLAVESGSPTRPCGGFPEERHGLFNLPNPQRYML